MFGYLCGPRARSRQRVWRSRERTLHCRFGQHFCLLQTSLGIAPPWTAAAQFVPSLRSWVMLWLPGIRRKLNFDVKDQSQLFKDCWIPDWAVNCPYTASYVWNYHSNWQALLKINKVKQRCLNFFGWADAAGKFWCWLQRCSMAVLKKSRGFLISQSLPVDGRSERDLKKQHVSVTSFLTCRS